MSKVPSDEDFDRADRLAEYRSRNLEKVRDKVIKHFEKVCPLVNFHILPQRDVDFRAYVFFKETKDIQECKLSGIVQEIEDFVYAELELVGRGQKEDITVAFEFDSDENVTANFEGDYFLRLR